MKARSGFLYRPPTVRKPSRSPTAEAEYRRQDERFAAVFGDEAGRLARRLARATERAERHIGSPLHERYSGAIGVELANAALDLAPDDASTEAVMGLLLLEVARWRRRLYPGVDLLSDAARSQLDRDWNAQLEAAMLAIGRDVRVFVDVEEAPGYVWLDPDKGPQLSVAALPADKAARKAAEALGGALARDMADSLGYRPHGKAGARPEHAPTYGGIGAKWRWARAHVQPGMTTGERFAVAKAAGLATGSWPGRTTDDDYERKQNIVRRLRASANG